MSVADRKIADALLAYRPPVRLTADG
jgi:hypothetical protein